ncbi:hypothetical protein N665_0079s0077 [Sinapis alba]|nr:hypothetical protein N665_0079s0077 [Sinapis alba]
MDGLIPMAFKAMMRKRIRRRYECLSSSGGTTKESYVLEEDFFPFDDKSNHSVVSRPSSSSFDHVEMNNVAAAQDRHRRGWSIGDVSSMSYHEGRRSRGDGGDIDVSPSRRGQLVRNRSHRLFSCVSGK